MRSPLKALVFRTREAFEVGLDDGLEADFEDGLTTVCETALLTAFFGGAFAACRAAFDEPNVFLFSFAA